MLAIGLPSANSYYTYFAVKETHVGTDIQIVPTSANIVLARKCYFLHQYILILILNLCIKSSYDASTIIPDTLPHQPSVLFRLSGIYEKPNS